MINSIIQLLRRCSTGRGKWNSQNGWHVATQLGMKSEERKRWKNEEQLSNAGQARYREFMVLCGSYSCVSKILTCIKGSVMGKHIWSFTFHKVPIQGQRHTRTIKETETASRFPQTRQNIQEKKLTKHTLLSLVYSVRLVPKTMMSTLISPHVPMWDRDSITDILPSLLSGRSTL